MRYTGRQTGGETRVHVLVVDDDAAIRDAIDAALSSEGHRVTTASDGRLALAEIHALKPDLVLLDVEMPHMDGWDFHEQVIKAIPGLPVVFMSGQFRARFAAMTRHADGYLAKPFTLDDLFDTVARFAK